MSKDAVNPNHYKKPIETIDYIIAFGIGQEFCQGNCIKYLSRYKEKNGIEDLEKAMWYLKMLMHLVSPETHQDPRKGDLIPLGLIRPHAINKSGGIK